VIEAKSEPATEDRDGDKIPNNKPTNALYYP